MTNRLSSLVQLATAIVISAVLAACGGSTKSPAAPSGTSAAAPVPVPPTGVSTGASIDGTVLGVSGGQAFGAHALGAGASISVMGTRVSSPIDASGHFSLRGVPSGDVTLQVTSNSTSAMLTLTGISDHEQIRITIQVSGSSASADDMDRETNDNRVEVEGRITAINGSILTVAGRNVSASGGTPIHHGSTTMQLSSLHVGDRIHVHGTNSGGGVAATDIEVQNGGTPEPGDDHGNDDNGGQQELSGTVSNRSSSSSCPAITFNIGGNRIATDSKTSFEDTSCTSLANGDRVEVKGTRQSTGTVLAANVEKK